MPPMTTRRAICCAALLFASIVPAATHGQELVSLPTRESVTQTFLLVAPPSGKPAAAVILLPGGNGAIQLRSEGADIKFQGGNFLVRSRMSFVNGGLAAAVMDAPSDESRGMSDQFRLSEKHAADISVVVSELKRRFENIRVYLVGTSRGTVSAAGAGSQLGDNVAGVVLTSSLFVGSRAGPGLSGFDYSKIKAPVLLVHHVEDSCRSTPYQEAQRIAGAQRYPLISVKGGEPARSDPCEAFSAHGYLGKEKETVDAIVNWILKKPYPATIE